MYCTYTHYYKYIPGLAGAPGQASLVTVAAATVFIVCGCYTRTETTSVVLCCILHKSKKWHSRALSPSLYLYMYQSLPLSHSHFAVTLIQGTRDTGTICYSAVYTRARRRRAYQRRHLTATVAERGVRRRRRRRHVDGDLVAMATTRWRRPPATAAAAAMAPLTATAILTLALGAATAPRRPHSTLAPESA